MLSRYFVDGVFLVPGSENSGYDRSMSFLYGLILFGFLAAYLSSFWIAVNALAESESFKKSPESKKMWSAVLATLSSLLIVLFISFVMGSRLFVTIAMMVNH